MNDVFARQYANFVRERLRPAVAAINARKRSGLLIGLGVGLGVFLFGAGVIYLFLAPYREIMKSSSLTFWPLLIMAPAALGVLAFTLIFVLRLRKTVGDFQNSLASGMAEFIDPGFVYEPTNPFSGEAVERSHLLDAGKRVIIGAGRFRGRAGHGAAEFADVTVRDGEGKKAPCRTGVFMTSRLEVPAAFPGFVFPAGAEVSISGLGEALKKEGCEVGEGLVRVERGGRQYLVPAGRESDVGALLSRRAEREADDLRAANGAELSLCVRGEDLYIALLGQGAKGEGGLFEALDFDGCREFCRSAKMGLGIVKGWGGRGTRPVVPENLS